MMIVMVLGGLTLSASAMAESTARAPGVTTEQELHGFLLRIDGDVVVSEREHVETVITINGDTRVRGSADSVVVIDGTAILEDARVRSLTVMNGHADLRGQTTIAGDVVLMESTLERAPSVVVSGEVRTGMDWIMPGFWVFGVLLPLGFLLAFVLTGLAAAALVPRGVRSAGAALTRSIGKTILMSLLLWIAVPVVMAVSFATIVTIPTGLGLFLFVLPVLGFLGYIVVGIRIGDAIVGAVRKTERTERPYLAAAVGITTLVLISLIPVVGSLVALLSGFLGAGAIMLAAWRRVRGR